MPKDTQYSQLNLDLDALKITNEQEVAAAIANHTHPTLGDINFTGTVSADGDEGLTGERTVGGYTLTFKKGLLVGFQSS